MAQHVTILEEINGDAVELPLEVDGTLLLSTLTGQYPETTGIRFKSDTGSWRGVRCEGNVIHPPPNGWGHTVYYIVRDDGHGDGRVKNDEPSEKRTKLNEVGYSLTGGYTWTLGKARMNGQDGLGPNVNRVRSKPKGPFYSPGKFPATFPPPGADGKIAFTAEDGHLWKLWPKQIQVYRKRHKEAQEAVARGETPTEASETPCDRLVTGRRGFHIVCKQPLCNTIGFTKIATDAIAVFRRYVDLLTPGVGQSTYFERKALEGGDPPYVFIETHMVDPAKLSDIIYKDLNSQNYAHTNVEALKCWVKFIPVHRTCAINVADIRNSIVQVIEPVFHEHARFGMFPQFQLYINGKHGLDMSMTVLKSTLLGDYFASKGYQVGQGWKEDSENCIHLRFKGGICFVSFLRNYMKYSKYIIKELS